MHQNLCPLAADIPKPKARLYIGTELVEERTSSGRLQRPPYLGPVGYGKLQEVTQTGGSKNKSRRCITCQKKRLFSKKILDHMQCQNKCFWHVLSSWWPVLALLKSQNALVMGYFGKKMGQKGVKNGSKMGQKCVFPKMILDLWGCTKK